MIRVEADDAHIMVDGGNRLVDHLPVIIGAQDHAHFRMADDIGQDARAGDKVQRGRQIAAGGDTGKAQGGPDGVL